MTVLPDIALAQSASRFQVRSQKSPGQICFGPGPLMTVIGEDGRETRIETQAERYARILREEGESDVWHPEQRETFGTSVGAALCLASAGLMCAFIAWVAL